MIRRTLLPSLVAVLVLATTSAPRAAIVFETFTDRAAFDTRLGGSVVEIDFDDIATSGDTAVAFDFDRYRFSHGARIFGPGVEQLVSRTFGLPADFQPTSPSNMYAPGPIASDFHIGGNTTQVFFMAGSQPALVAGVGVVFIDADMPGVAASKLDVYDHQAVIGNAMLLASTGTVSGASGSQLFRGIVAIDNQTDMPAPVIGFSYIFNGQGWPGLASIEGVALDDLVFATPVANGGIPGEGDCDDCLDGESDQTADRLDAECPAPAAGGGVGLGDPGGRGKAIVKCQQALAKAGAGFASKKLKLLQGCFKAIQTCLQVKFQDIDPCLQGAAKKCTAAVDKIAAAETKLTGAVGKGCTSTSDLLALEGLGFEAEVDVCAAHGVTPLDSVAAVAACLVRAHECRVEQIASLAVPRAREMLDMVGIDPDDFPCLDADAMGGQNGLGDVTRGKGLLKCQKTIDKQGAGLLKNRQKLVQKCLGGVFKCLQLKPGDAACLSKAQAQCIKIISTIGFGNDALATVMRAAIGTTCGEVPFNDLVDVTGLGFGTIEDRCDDTLSTSFEIGRCLAEQDLCRVDRLLDEQLPRAQEMRVLGELVQN